ncbi:MAG: DUF3307 domain-containing protein [Bacteroidota bacterium]
MMPLFIKLILAHLIGDFAFQPKKWVEHKNKNTFKSKYLYFHVAVHAIALMLVLEFNTDYWLAFVIIIPSHFLIDLGKLMLQNKKNQRWIFALDQFLHVSVIALIVEWYRPYLTRILNLDATQLLLFISCLIGVTSMTAITMRVIISKWNIESYNNSKDSLKNAGTMIGVLERLFVFFFVVNGIWSGVGFLLAAKSIFRFGDLSKAKDRKLTEYVLIGTLISFGMAILIGIIYLQLIQYI